MHDVEDPSDAGTAGQTAKKKRGRKRLGGKKKTPAQRNKEYRQRGVPLASMVLTEDAGEALQRLLSQHREAARSAWSKREIVSAALIFAAGNDLTPILCDQRVKAEGTGSTE